MDRKTNFRSRRLFYATKEGLEAKGAKIHMETEVEKIDLKIKKFMLQVKMERSMRSLMIN